MKLVGTFDLETFSLPPYLVLDILLTELDI